MAGSQPRQALLEVLTQPLADSGYDLEDVEVSAAGRRRLVRVLVDKDGGVTLDDVAEAATVAGAVLDDSDVLEDSPYTLEVTSPGTDRPLTLPRHWRRNTERLVTVRPHEGGTFTGRVLEADDTEVTFDVKGQRRTVPYAAVARAKVEIEFNRPKPDPTASEEE